MEKTLKELADLVDGTISGDPETRIKGVSGIQTAREGQITFLSNKKYRGALDTTDASAIVIDQAFDSDLSIPALKVENPDIAFARIADVFTGVRQKNHEPGIHESAVVSDKAQVAEDAYIGPHVTIGEQAEIGPRSIIKHGTYVGDHVKIGADTTVYPSVTLLRETRVGNKVTIHSSTVIGSDGFGYVRGEEGDHQKIPQTGIVIIEDHVEIGAGVTIDRARFEETRICEGVKMDNQVQVAHNVYIGENTVIVSQAGVAGSAEIGSGTVIAGQSGIGGHLNVGDNVQVAARAGVTKDVETGKTVAGFPAEERSDYNRKQVLIRKLPELAQRVEELTNKIKQLENNERENEQQTKDN